MLLFGFSLNQFTIWQLEMFCTNVTVYKYGYITIVKIRWKLVSTYSIIYIIIITHCLPGAQSNFFWYLFYLFCSFIVRVVSTEINQILKRTWNFQKITSNVQRRLQIDWGAIWVIFVLYEHFYEDMCCLHGNIQSVDRSDWQFFV